MLTNHKQAINTMQQELSIIWGVYATVGALPRPSDISEQNNSPVFSVKATAKDSVNTFSKSHPCDYQDVYVAPVNSTTALRVFSSWAGDGGAESL